MNSKPLDDISELSFRLIIMFEDRIIVLLTKDMPYGIYPMRVGEFI